VSLSQLEKLREIYRKQVISELRDQMKVSVKRSFPRQHFLKKFLLHDCLVSFHCREENEKMKMSGQQS
jgi:hypothetical protein